MSTAPSSGDGFSSSWPLFASFLAFSLVDLLLLRRYRRSGDSYISSLSEKALVNYVSRTISSVHAVISTALGLCCMLTASWTTHSMLVGSTALQVNALLFTTGYLCYDFVSMMRRWDALGDCMMVVHHLVCTSSFLLGIAYSRANFIQTAFLINEASTPFLNQRWFLIQAGKRGSTMYTVNLWMFALTFTVFRVLWNTIMLSLIASVWTSNEIWSAYANQCIEFTVCCVLTSLAVVHCCINYYWGNTIIRKVLNLHNTPAPASKTDFADRKEE